MAEQILGYPRRVCLVDCGLPAEQCACYMAEYELTHVDKADAWDAIVEKSREITRLRAALADAQAVGFAAGVEAAAKRCDAIAGNTADFNHYHRRAAGQCGAAIRALTPPDLTAAAARVLLADDIQIARMAGAVHDGPLGADDYWFSAATESGAWCVDAVRVALRAIAGDTP